MVVITRKFKMMVIRVALLNMVILFVLCSLTSLEITIGRENVAIVNIRE